MEPVGVAGPGHLKRRISSVFTKHSVDSPSISLRAVARDSPQSQWCAARKCHSDRTLLRRGSGDSTPQIVRSPPKVLLFLRPVDHPFQHGSQPAN